MQCSKTCGGGIITRILSCKKLNKDGQYSPVPKIFCQNAVKPPVNEACNDDIPCFGEYKSTSKLLIIRLTPSFSEQFLIFNPLSLSYI